MKKYIYSLAVLACTAFAFTSCGSDDDNSGSTPTPTPTPDPSERVTVDVPVPTALETSATDNYASQYATENSTNVPGTDFTSKTYGIDAVTACENTVNQLEKANETIQKMSLTDEQKTS